MSDVRSVFSNLERSFPIMFSFAIAFFYKKGSELCICFFLLVQGSAAVERSGRLT